MNFRDNWGMLVAGLGLVVTLVLLANGINARLDGIQRDIGDLAQRVTRLEVLVEKSMGTRTAHETAQEGGR